MFSLNFRTISFLSILIFSYFTFHSYEHYFDHLSGTHDESECTYFDLIKFAPTNYQNNDLPFFGIENKKCYHKNSKYLYVSRLYDPRGPPII